LAIKASTDMAVPVIMKALSMMKKNNSG